MTGSIEPSGSLFTYLPYTNLSSFSNPSYRPLFDVQPGQSVFETCGGDAFCVFDSTVTGDASFGQATLAVVREESAVVDLVAPGEGGRDRGKYGGG